MLSSQTTSRPRSRRRTNPRQRQSQSPSVVLAQRRRLYTVGFQPPVVTTTTTTTTTRPTRTMVAMSILCMALQRQKPVTTFRPMMMTSSLPTHHRRRFASWGSHGGAAGAAAASVVGPVVGTTSRRRGITPHATPRTNPLLFTLDHSCYSRFYRSSYCYSSSSSLLSAALSANDHLDLENNHHDSTTDTLSSSITTTSTSSSMPHYHFPISAPHLPSGDQPQAIQTLFEQLQHKPLKHTNQSPPLPPQQRRRGQKYSILRGCTGTGKTLVMAHTVARLGRCKTLVLCHNKTLAAQLARELRTFFHPDQMAVELFVSYYKHYIPESFSETTSRYIAKKSAKSDELDALRHLATKALLEASSSSSSSSSSLKKKPTIVVSSVSCIYGLGMPSSYLNAALQFQVGQSVGTLNHLTTDLLERTGLYTNVMQNENENDEGKDRGDTNTALLHNSNNNNNTNSSTTMNPYHNGGKDDLSLGQYHLVTQPEKPSSATLFLWPPTEAFPMRIDLERSSSDNSKSSNINDTLFHITNISKGHAQGMANATETTVFPARHYVAPDAEQFEEACRRIQDELQDQVQCLRSDFKNVEADRLSQRVSQDLLLLRETGTCPGIENYSRHMALRDEGEAPDTLLDYMGFQIKTMMTTTTMTPDTTTENNADSATHHPDEDWLLIVDESHVTLPQLKAMYYGDRARKLNLVKHGYRLPSCLDNRPLTNDEFWERVPQTLFVSATPAAQELAWLEQQELDHQVEEEDGNDHDIDNEDEEEDEDNEEHRLYMGPVDMMIRPTFVCDPIIEVRPALGGQLNDLVKEVRAEKANGGYRTLALALTKRDAEDLADYLVQQGIPSTYIHSGLTTLERSQALTALQEGTVDCLVGVNLLREGLDLPEVSLVAVFNSDSEGFLRSETALLQMVGRAARNMHGRAILYANRITDSMRNCIDVSAKRRDAQLAYNAKHGKIMKSTKGSSVMSIFDLSKDRIQAENERSILDFSSTTKDTSTVGKSTEVAPSSIWDGTTPPEFVLETVSVPISVQASYVTSMSPSSAVEVTIETDHIPSKPGVYFWKDVDGNILYIGKAKRLRSRVKSYLSPATSKQLKDTRSIRIRAMLDKAASVEFVLTPSDRDALLLESNLIKHHQPLYNVLLKDDESYPYICATIGDTYPQFTIAPRRQQGVSAAKYRYFGPYPHYSEVNTILQGIEATYDLRGKSFQARHGSTNASAGREEYKQLFERVMGEVFSTDSGDSSIYSRTHDGAQAMPLPTENLGLPALRSQYEEASKLFDSPFNDCRDVVAVARIPTDGTSLSSTAVVIHVVQLRKGLLAGSFSYTCELAISSSPEQEKEDYAAAIQTVLERRHYPSGEGSTNGQFSFFPNEILVEYPLVETGELKASIRAARNQVGDASFDRSAPSGYAVNIRTASSRRPRKETDERALQFARDNAEQVALEKSFSYTPNVAKTSVDGTAMKDLASLLSLDREPHRIECYDISHTQGDVAVGSRVVFINGKPAPKLYRKFNIKTVQGVDDYASLAEVLERRFKRAWINAAGGLVDASDPWSMPDLVVIDGGQGQLSAAVLGMSRAGVFPRSKVIGGSQVAQDALVYANDLVEEIDEVMQSMNGRSTTVPIIALAKQYEEVFVHGEKGPVNDSPDSAALLLLRSLRDESHRFAVTSHRKRRSALNGL